MKNKIIPYNPVLKEIAKKLRKQGILTEALLWMKIKNKSLGLEFHRQVPLNNFIVDFYCHEIMLAIELDGNSHIHSDVQANDALRQETLEKLGVNFIRFTDLEIKKSMNEVIHNLQIKIEELKIRSE